VVTTVTTVSTAPGSPGSPLWDPTAVPAATVIVVRDAAAGVEVLMLKRDSKLSFAGGHWVFPGGRIDPADRAAPDGSEDGDLEAAARRAAVREAAEEAGLVIVPDSLLRWSHWTPPPESPKRYSTAFFVAPLTDAEAVVRIDDSEIRDHRWARPADVITMRDDGEVELSPPTFITLVQLGGPPTVADLMIEAESRVVEHFATRIAAVEDTMVALYHGDVAYEGDDPSNDGPRHRLWLESNWRYERTTQP